MTPAHDLDVPPVDLERVGASEHRRGALAMSGVIVLWVALAAWHPTVTYHLAPLCAAAVWPFLLKRGPLRVAWADTVTAAVTATALTVVTGVALTSLGLLQGPTLWNRGHALVEVIPLAVAGAVLGARRARCGVGPLPDA